MPDPSIDPHSYHKNLTLWFRDFCTYPAWAMRECLREGYGAASLRADVLAGLTVGIVALPLSMALAIASGVPPQHGLYTAIVAGAIIALLGGSRLSVSGPTAAFVVILAPISAQYGLSGLLVASVLSGFFLLLFGMVHLGKLIQFIPHPVTTGFTAGIAVVIAMLQLKDFFGLPLERMPDHFAERLGALSGAVPSFRWQDALIGVVTLLILVLWPRFTRKVPAPLVAVGTGAVLAVVLHRFLPDFSVATIASRFSFTLGGETLPGIPSMPPAPNLPWRFTAPGEEPLGISMQMIGELIGPAMAIAMLGAIESLLCAVIADGMAGTKHNPDAELMAQGVGNIVAPFFGGIPATAAIARTAANFRSGGKSPISAFVHAIFLLLAMLLFAPLLGYLPMASLAALLLVVAWNMSDARHFFHVLKVAPAGDIAVLLTCFGLTVVFDMVIAVSVGIVLAALLFMRRMAEITETRFLRETHEMEGMAIPAGVIAYEVAGPLFFGAAEKAFASLSRLSQDQRPKALVLNLHAVPVMDMTGLVALETLLARAHRKGLMVLLAGVRPQPRGLLKKAGIEPTPGKIAFVHDLEQAFMLAEMEVGGPGGESFEGIPKLKG